MKIDDDIEVMVLMGSYSKVEYADYALIVNHTNKTYVRVYILNKRVMELLKVFNIPFNSTTLQRFKDVKEFKKIYPKYK